MGQWCHISEIPHMCISKAENSLLDYVTYII